MMRPGLAVSMVAGLAFCSWSSPAQATDISSCEAIVQDGVLAADLDCSAAQFAVSVRDGGTLDFAGHTLIAAPSVGITCERRCSILGNGGTLTGTTSAGIRSYHKRSEIAVEGLTVATQYGTGISGHSLGVTSCVVSGPEAGIFASGDLRLADSSISNTAWGVTLRRKSAQVVNSTIVGKGWGVFSEGRVAVSGSTVSGNDNTGIHASRVDADSSVLESNGVAPGCYAQDSRDCVDVLTRRLVLDDASSCHHSGGLVRVGGGNLEPSGEPLATCSLD